LIRIGGKPTNTVPVYTTLGESPEGEFGMRWDIQKNAEEIRIPVKEIDMKAVTFTYPDSMYEMIVDVDGKKTGGGRTNTPKVYLYSELPEVIQKFRVYENYRYYVEAQVWNRDMLHKYWLKMKGGIQ